MGMNSMLVIRRRKGYISERSQQAYMSSPGSARAAGAARVIPRGIIYRRLTASELPPGQTSGFLASIL